MGINKQAFGWSSELCRNIYANKHRQIRMIAYCGITEFVNTAHANFNDYNCGYSWIRNRTGRAGNQEELDLLSKYPNKMLIIDACTHEILHIIPLKES